MMIILQKTALTLDENKSQILKFSQFLASFLSKNVMLKMHFHERDFVWNSLGKNTSKYDDEQFTLHVQIPEASICPWGPGLACLNSTKPKVSNQVEDNQKRKKNDEIDA